MIRSTNSTHRTLRLIRLHRNGVSTEVALALSSRRGGDRCGARLHLRWAREHRAQVASLCNSYLLAL